MIIPCFRYSDPRAAIEWLGQAFGFTPLFISENPDGSVGHVELQLEDSVIMLGATRDDVWKVSTPNALGAATVSMYVPVADVDAHHARAIAAGATILMPLAEMSYGSREYTVRDLDGHIWGFGTYRPTL